MKDGCEFFQGYFFALCYGPVYKRNPFTPDTVQYLEWEKGYDHAVLENLGEVS